MPAALSALIVLVGFLNAAPAATPSTIRVGIVPKAETFRFVCEGRYQVADLEGHSHELKRDVSYEIAASDGRLSLGELTLPAEARLKSEDLGSVLRIGSHRYGGTLIVRANEDDTVTAISELGIEEYLLGVLPQEMDAAWPLEALKAQAVVARSFAYASLGRSVFGGFDLTADTRSQVYGGIGTDSPVVRQAVLQTRGEVLSYKGRLLRGYYHSCCGGHTADAGIVWPSNEDTPRPLRGVKDGYCKKSPLYRWESFASYDEVVTALQGKKLFGGRLSRFDLLRSPSGWARAFAAKIGGRAVEIKANDFRLALGASRLKSGHILSLRKNKAGIDFFGAGSGHGVGLCQWGARAQAEAGRGYTKILKYYFPSSVLSVVEP